MPPIEVSGPGVLVVDDDSDIGDSISDLLRAGGYQPYAVRDGEGALARARLGGIALVLLDWRLPVGPSGVALVRKLRELCGAGLPIVVLSADPGSLAEARVAQVSDYLPKPFEVDDLMHLVSEYCPD